MEESRIRWRKSVAARIFPIESQHFGQMLRPSLTFPLHGGKAYPLPSESLEESRNRQPQVRHVAHPPLVFMEEKRSRRTLDVPITPVHMARVLHNYENAITTAFPGTCPFRSLAEERRYRQPCCWGCPKTLSAPTPACASSKIHTYKLAATT